MMANKTKMITKPAEEIEVAVEVTVTCDVCKTQVTVTKEDKLQSKDPRHIYDICMEKFGERFAAQGGYLSVAHHEDGSKNSVDGLAFELDICFGCLSKYGRTSDLW